LKEAGPRQEDINLAQAEISQARANLLQIQAKINKMILKSPVNGIITAIEKEEGETDSIETVIGPSVHVEGNFVANGDIVIEGVVSGSIKTERNLRIGENAKIYANIWAANATIAGEVQGNVKIKENLELTSTGRIFGDVKTKVINIGPGASLHGKCKCRGRQKN